jgi:phage gp29-like protein
MPELPLPIVQRPDLLPPGQAGVVVPHEETYSAMFNTLSKTYSSLYDEAVLDSINNAVAMRFDPIIMEPLETRQRSVCQLTWHLEPEDANDQRLVAAAADVEKRARKMPYLQDFLMSQQEALWFGRAGAQVIYRWHRNSESRLGIVPTKHVPIDGDKLVFGYDGRLGIRVSGVFNSKTTEFNDYGRVHFFTESERQAVVVHRHKPEDASFFRPIKAGQINGVGLRERLYWFWAMKNQALGLLADYLKWFAQGLTVYYYELGNKAAHDEVKARARENVGQPFLLFPRERTGGPDWKPIERFEPGAASTNLMQALITQYFDTVIRRMILGQTLTTTASATGLGSNLGDVQAETFAGIVKYDATALQDSLTQDYVAAINNYSYPGYPTPRWVFEIDAPNIQEIVAAAEFFLNYGGEIGMESMRKILGLPAPKPGEAILGKVQPMQPAAVTGQPVGVPTYDAATGEGQAGAGEALAEAGQPAA